MLLLYIEHNRNTAEVKNRADKKSHNEAIQFLKGRPKGISKYIFPPKSWSRPNTCVPGSRSTELKRRMRQIMNYMHETKTNRGPRLANLRHLCRLWHLNVQHDRRLSTNPYGCAVFLWLGTARPGTAAGNG